VPLILGVCTEVAVIAIGPPTATPDASPAALIVASAMFELAQFTVTGPAEPSEK
jgi:hypothetical protein